MILRSFIREVITESRQKHAAVALVVAQDGKVLSVSRKDDPTKFGLPGGKVDPGEDAETAIARELREETGLDVIELRPVFSCKDEGQYVTTTFICDVEGEIDTNESGEVRWIDWQMLISPEYCPFHAYNKKLFTHLGWI